MNELTEVAKVLQEKDEHAFTLLDVFPQMVWMATPEGELDYGNKPFHTYTGWKPGKEKKREWSTVIHPDDVTSSLEKWKKSLASGSFFEVEQRIRRNSDGAYLWHLVRAVPVKNQEGQIFKWVGTSVDIHSQKKIEETLSNFVYIATHDLRSPVNNLKALMSLFKTRPMEEWEKLLPLLDLSAEKMSETLQGLVELVAIEKTRDPAKEIFFDQILDLVVEELHPEIKESGASITTNFSACPKIQYIEPYLQRIFHSLLANAVKYSSPGRRNEIQVLSERKKDLVVLTFSDKGNGIDLDKYQEKLFRPFTRLTTAGKGRGMDLYLVKNIVEKNGGNIEVESQVDKGTTFRFYLKEYRTQ